MPIVFTFVRDPLSYSVSRVEESYTRMNITRGMKLYATTLEEKIHLGKAKKDTAINLIASMINFDLENGPKLSERIHFAYVQHS